MTDRLALIAGVNPDAVTVDTVHKRAVVRAKPLPDAGLATYKTLEVRAAAMAPGWIIEVEPPVLPLPELELDKDGRATDRDALELALWASQRTGMALDMAVRREGDVPALKIFSDRGVDARLVKGASADRAILRWRLNP